MSAASPVSRATPATLVALVGNRRGIESLHWIRDVVYREDASQVRTRFGPRAMAALRNLTIGAHRLVGRNGIAEAARWASRFMRRPFEDLGPSPLPGR